jgi:hypothetical protein
MSVSEEFVRSKLAPYEGRIRAVIDRAWQQFLEIPCRHKFLFPRTRANIVFDLIAGEIFDEFDVDPSVHITRKNETVKFLVRDRGEDEVLCRIKKANGSGLGSNIRTQEVMDFICQEPGIPGLLGDLHKIEICYFEDPTGAEIASVHVTARDNDVKLWSYEIEREEPGAAGGIVRFPTMPPDAPPPEVTLKPAKKEDKGDSE